MTKILASRSAALGFLTAAATALYICVCVVVSPRVIDGTSPQQDLIASIGLAYALSMYALLIAGVVLLLRRKLLMSVRYLTAGTVAYLTIFYAVPYLKDDRLIFPSGAHREIAGIYRKQDVDFDLKNPAPHLVSLDEQCHPPSGCTCWVLIDADHKSAVEHDLGGWRQPTAPIFSPDPLPVRFGIVNVRVLDSAAYSILACNVDWFAWNPA